MVVTCSGKYDDHYLFVANKTLHVSINLSPNDKFYSNAFVLIGEKNVDVYNEF